MRTLRFDQRGYADGVVGHDLGALVGWSLAGRRPDRVATLTVLSVPHPSAFAASFLSSTQALRSWYAGLSRSGVSPSSCWPSRGWCAACSR